MGRPIAYQGEKVPFTGVGATQEESDLLFHESADGGAVYTKEDGSGYYYASNSEEGNAEDGEFTGGVFVLVRVEYEEWGFTFLSSPSFFFFLSLSHTSCSITGNG